MKRAYFYIHANDHRSLNAFLKSSGRNLSEFARDAIAEKLDRDRVTSNLDAARDAMEDVVEQLRVEMARMRKDVLEDSRRTAALLQEENQQSLKKNEQLYEAFIRALGRAEPAPPNPSKSPPRTSLNVPGM